MPNKVYRIIIDTNLWISFLITKDLSEIDDIIFPGKCILIFSQELMEEFLDVARRPKFKKYFSKKDIELILQIIDGFAELITVTSELKICRDPKDNFLLSLAVDGRADFLLTGDKDLLDIAQIESTKILTIAAFLGKI